MQKLLTSEQIRLADQYTIRNKPIASIDLMEAASRAFADVFIRKFPDRKSAIAVYCGTGNNGGDGLAVARILRKEGYENISVKIVRFSDRSTAEFDVNFERLSGTGIAVTELKPGGSYPDESADLIIDALIGSGLNKALQGDLKLLVNYLNGLERIVVAIDVPTGFFAEGAFNPDNTIVKSDLTISFQRPKINFLLPESAPFIREFQVVDIGLDEEFIQSTPGSFTLITEADIRRILVGRRPFSHKGTYGHAFIIAGSEETMGAALLSAGSSVYSGAGLTTACIPSSGLVALNSLFPEAMAFLRDKHSLQTVKWEKYQSVAIGPGLGVSLESKEILEITLKRSNMPLVIDADGINLISENYELMGQVPEGSVFTPHVKEFDRLFGNHSNWWSRLQTGMEYSKQLRCVILLKNRYSVVFTPKGECIFNPTGTPAMATGGMGDVLTGMVVSFLAQGYTSEEAVLLAVYIHGRAGEVLVEDR